MELSSLTSQFKKFAEDVAANHVFLSVNTDRYKRACQRVLSLEHPPQHPPRVVVVVGAGASHAACGLPLGTDAAKELRKRLNRVNQELLNEELERLTLEYRLNETDFETQLLALSKFDQRRLVEELSHIFYRRYYPSLSYELLAHMLKHRFLDAIINFNFDELLDQAILDEVGEGNYYRVVSDGDCPDNVDEWLNQKRFRLPLYIKPHGTASQKSSLRFTRSLYTLLPPEFRKLLEALFESKEEPVKVLVLGHAMQSIEFNDILSRYARSDSEVLFIDKRVPTPLEDSIREFYRDGFLQVRDKTDDLGEASLDDRLKELWEAVSDSFRDGYKPRQIKRHELISKLFARRIDYRQQPDNQKHSELTIYLKDRAFVELALAIAKTKGFAHLHQLAEGRPGKYFRLYKENRSKVNTSEKHGSLYEMCQSLDLQQAGYSREALRLGPMAGNPGYSLSSLIVNPDDLEQALVDLEEALTPHLSWAILDKVNEHKTLLRETLVEMYRGDEVEVSAFKNVAHHEAFATSKLLPTLTALKEETMRRLEEREWDRLLVVAETGQWLTQPDLVAKIKAKNRVKLALIVADDTWRDKLGNLFGPQLGVIRILPWWLHNQHMTLFLRERQVSHGIYFERRLRASQIMPLFLSDNDARALLDTFVAYLMKADRYRDKSLERYILPDDLADEKEKFLDELYDGFRRPLSKQSPRD